LASVAAGAILVATCTDSRGVAPLPATPRVTQVAAAANPNNALSVLVAFHADGADSARLLYENATGPLGDTPFVHVNAGSERLVALGLHPSTVYTFAVEAVGAGGSTQSAPVTTMTGELPPPIRALRLASSGAPSSGYTLATPLGAPTDSNTFVIAFDSAGQIAWYREFTDQGWAVEAKQQANGDITVYLGRSYGWQADYGQFVEVTPAGDIVRRFAAGSPSFTDPHELLLSFRDSSVSAAHLLGYELRHFDLSAFGGSADSVLAVHTIERQNAAGVTEFRWRSGDEYTPSDWPAVNRLTGDLVHPSSLALDVDGNYVVSLQAMDEITKVDARTGATIWRLGGRHNQFAIVDDPLNGFQGQHSVRVLGDGHLLLMDNRLRSQPPWARAVEYDVDAGARVARLVWQYSPSPPVASPIMGSVQRLANHNTVVGFAAAGRVDEVTPAGLVVWQATLLASDATPVSFYRAIRIASLYRFLSP